MNFDSILGTIKSTFMPRKKVDFEDSGLHFELEPLDSIEESKIMESIKDFDGAQYMEALKRHSLAFSIKKMNDLEITSDIEYINEKGEKKFKSKFLYMIDFIGKWPTSLIDALYEAYSNMNIELENKIKKEVKFEVFTLSEKIPEEESSNLRRIEDDEIPDSELSEEELLAKKVKQEEMEALSNAEKEIDIKLAK